jgi:hypothetical protein
MHLINAFEMDDELALLVVVVEVEIAVVDVVAIKIKSSLSLKSIRFFFIPLSIFSAVLFCQAFFIIINII